MSKILEKCPEVDLKPKVVIDSYNNVIRIKVIPPCSFTELMEAIIGYEKQVDTNNIAKVLFTNGTSLYKQNIHIVSGGDSTYYIGYKPFASGESENTHILKATPEESVIFKSGFVNKNFDITISNAKGTYHYGNREENNTLTKSAAYTQIGNIIKELQSMEGIFKIEKFNDRHEYLNLSKLYYVTGIVYREYIPLINDDEIALYWRPISGETDINKVNTYTVFNIVLQETHESIGTIGFSYERPGFSYRGNVSYKIHEEFRNKGYATRALHLLKCALVNHEFSGDRDLYVALASDNVPSERIAVKNGGQLVYSGEVPHNDSVYFETHIESVKVYRIEINKPKKAS